MVIHYKFAKDYDLLILISNAEWAKQNDEICVHLSTAYYKVELIV